KGSVARRGLCGDVYLVASPATARLSDAKVETSVRRGEVNITAGVQHLAENKQYLLRARVSDGAREVAMFASKAFTAGDLKASRISFSSRWKPDRLWDLHTPQNQYE